MQVHARLVAPADKELFHPPFDRNLLEWLFRVANRQGYENGARPRRNLVDVEPKPLGKEYDLRRDCRHSIVVVLPKEAQIDFGKGIDFGDPAHFQNLLPSAHESGMVRVVSGQLQAEVGFHRGANVGGAGSVNAPASILVLVLQNVICRLGKTTRVPSAEKRVQQNVVGFQRGIGL